MGFKELAVTRNTDTSQVALGVVGSGVAANNKRSTNTVTASNQDGKEAEILAQIAENTESTAKNTEKPKTGGQAKAGPDEDAIKKKLSNDDDDKKDDDKNSKLKDSIIGVSDAILAFGATAAVIATNTADQNSILGKIRDSISNLFNVAVDNPGKTALGAGAAAAAAEVTRRKIVNADPRGTVRDTQGKLRTKDGKFAPDPKAQKKAGQKAKEKVKDQVKKKVGLKIAGKLATRGALAATGIGAIATAGLLAYDIGEFALNKSVRAEYTLTNPAASEEDKMEAFDYLLKEDPKRLGVEGLENVEPQQRMAFLTAQDQNPELTVDDFNKQMLEASPTERKLIEEQSQTTTPSAPNVTPAPLSTNSAVLENAFDASSQAQITRDMKTTTAAIAAGTPTPAPSANQAPQSDSAESISTSIAVKTSAVHDVAQRLKELHSIGDRIHGK